MNNTSLIKTKDLKATYWKELIHAKKVQPDIIVNKQVDAISFYISPQGKDRIITHYLNEQVALLYRYADKEIVGLRIESFEKSFIPKYAKLQQVWKLRNAYVHNAEFSNTTLEITKKAWPVAEELFKITKPIINKQGVDLEPILA